MKCTASRWGHHLATLVQLWLAVPFFKVCTSLSATSTSPHRRSSWVSSSELLAWARIRHFTDCEACSGYPDLARPLSRSWSRSSWRGSGRREGTDNRAYSRGESRRAGSANSLECRRRGLLTQLAMVELLRRRRDLGGLGVRGQRACSIRSQT